MSSPFFSIVIPLYNKELFIGQTLDSVLAQTFTDFEIIIIDDGCTDKSVAIVNSLEDDRIKLFHQKNQGLSIARNNGIKNSNSDYIALIDADDTWSDHHLQQLYNLIKDYPENGVYGTGYVIQKSKNINHRANFYKLPENFRGIVPNFFKHSLQHCVAWVGSICIPKKVFEAMDYFDTEIFSEQDTDLYIKIALNGYKFVLDDTSISAVHYKASDNNNLSNYKNKVAIPKFLNAYKVEEKENIDLKKYMDLNRFSTLVFFKMSGKKTLEKQLRKDVNLKNLTRLQKYILMSPNVVVKTLFYLKEKLKLNPFIVFKH